MDPKLQADSQTWMFAYELLGLLEVRLDAIMSYCGDLLSLKDSGARAVNMKISLDDGSHEAPELSEVQ